MHHAVIEDNGGDGGLLVLGRAVLSREAAASDTTRTPSFVRLVRDLMPSNLLPHRLLWQSRCSAGCWAPGLGLDVGLCGPFGQLYGRLGCTCAAVGLFQCRGAY